MSTTYLFIFINGGYYIVRENSFKKALKDCAAYVGIFTEVLKKCIDGFLEEEYEDLVAVFNKFSITDADKIESIYEVNREIF